MKFSGSSALAAVLVLLVCTLAQTVYARVQLGNEVLVERKFKVLAGKRVGLITNPSGVNRNLESTIEVLRVRQGERHRCNAPGAASGRLSGGNRGIVEDGGGTIPARAAEISALLKDRRTRMAGVQR